MIQGLRTVIYPTPDLARGKAWYSQVLGHAPYFDEPFYVGFSVGGFELGLIPDGVPASDGPVVYWGVADAAAELQRLTQLGGTVHEPVKDVGGGIKVAAVKDPVRNPFGATENPHSTPRAARSSGGTARRQRCSPLPTGERGARTPVPPLQGRLRAVSRPAQEIPISLSGRGVGLRSPDRRRARRQPPP